MNNEEVLKKMKRIKNNLENARTQLTNAKNILNQSITFGNEGFKSETISNLNTKLNKQINNLNNKIIPKINNV